MIECVSTVIIIFLSLSYVGHVTQAQNDVSFTPIEKFNIPASNSTITFAFNGTYTKATLANDTWTFVNLHLNYSQPLEKLEVAAQDSNVTIVSYFTFNTTFRGALFSYRVEGQGKQTFNIGLPLAKGEWSVLLEGDFMGEGDGWHVSPDHTLTITGAKSNATIWYFGFPVGFDVDDDSNNPFFLQHSVAVATIVALVATSSFAFIIRRKNQKASNKTAWSQTHMSINRRWARTNFGGTHK